MSQACSEMPAYERGTSPKVAQQDGLREERDADGDDEAGEMRRRPRMPTATTAVTVATTAESRIAPSIAGTYRHVLRSSNVNRPPRTANTP